LLEFEVVGTQAFSCGDVALRFLDGFDATFRRVLFGFFSLSLLSVMCFLFCLLYGPGGDGGGRGGDVGAEDVGAGGDDGVNASGGNSAAGLEPGWGFRFLFCFCLLVGVCWLLCCAGSVFVVCGCSLVSDVCASFW
jgi:hypothetical protein